MRSFVPIVCNHLLTLSFGVVGVRMISSIVPPDIYGSYALFLTLTQLGALLSHAGLMNHASRNWQRQEAARGAYLTFLARKSLRNGLFLLPGLVILVLALDLYHENVAWLSALPLLWLSNVALAANGLATLILNAGGRYWTMLSLGAAAAAGRAFLPVAFVLMIGATFSSLASGFTCHSLIVAALVGSIFWGLCGRTKPEEAQERQWLQELARYGRPFIFLGIGGWLLQSADRWIVDFYFGSERAGMFALASSLSAIVPNAADAVLMQLVFPYVFREADSARTPRDWVTLARFCDRATAVFVVTSLVGLAALAVVGPHLLDVVIARNYRDAIPILWFAGAAMVTVKINQFHYLLLQGQHNSRAMVKVMLTVASVKTLGGCAAATVSWEAFLLWLLVSPVLTGIIGRWMIHRAFRRGLAAVEDHPGGREKPKDSTDG